MSSPYPNANRTSLTRAGANNPDVVVALLLRLARAKTRAMHLLE
jgi:hypothetical protein